MRYIIVFILIIIIISFIGPNVSANYASGTRTPIKHVINILFENHSFDNLFGIYPRDTSSHDSSIIMNISIPYNLLSNQSTLKQMSAIPPGNFSTSDPIEGYIPYHEDWNYGNMNNFASGSGSQSMTYYTAAQVAPLWDLAEEYSIADNYFAPQLSESAPNTLYYLAGFSPVFNDYGPPPWVPFNETIFGELNRFNVSWGVFVNGPSKTFDMSNFIEGIGHYQNNIYSWSTLIHDLSNGNVPAVSYIFSQDSNGYDMGAPSNILKGELWLLTLINSIEASPIWNSTAVFITWDDPGGYYDQVPPPIIDGVQFGMRLPLIVISPYAKENYVSNTVMTHSSIISFIDYNWNMPALNTFVSYLPLPLDMFNFDIGYPSSVIARQPLFFNNFPLPSSIYFNLNETQLEFNYSSQFPMIPQVNFNKLAYPNYGKSTLSLYDLDVGVFVSHDISTTPFIYSEATVILFVTADLFILYIVARRSKYDGKQMD